MLIAAELLSAEEEEEDEDVEVDDEYRDSDGGTNVNPGRDVVCGASLSVEEMSSLLLTTTCSRSCPRRR